MRLSLLNIRLERGVERGGEGRVEKTEEKRRREEEGDRRRGKKMWLIR